MIQKAKGLQKSKNLGTGFGIMQLSPFVFKWQPFLKIDQSKGTWYLVVHFVTTSLVTNGLQKVGRRSRIRFIDPIPVYVVLYEISSTSIVDLPFVLFEKPNIGCCNLERISLFHLDRQDPRSRIVLLYTQSKFCCTEQ